MLEGLYAERFVDRATYDRNVSFRAVDMNDIPPDLGHFDFIWSAGSLEHIGGHQNGLDFIVRSMDNLKPSGIAVHTTEFTISSETVSYDTPEISFYSRADITQLAKRLIDDGHFIVLNFRRGDTVADTHVDIPPFHQGKTLAAHFNSHVVTSIGLIIQKSGQRD